MGLADLPTLAEVQAARTGPISKGPTRLDSKAEQDTTNEQKAEAYRRAVRTRDHHICRCCGRHVVVSLKLQKHQAHVHHLYGRARAFRFDVRFGILLCAEDHGRVERFELYPIGALSDAFDLNGKPHLDATHEVSFLEMAA